MSRTIKRLAGAAALTLAAAGIIAVPSAAWAAGTTYYVDAISGSDAAAGTSPGTAWQSLAKVNATTFVAGDQILFKGGQTWSGQLYPKGSGAAGSPIVLSSYGTGMPKIDGAPLVSGGAVYLKNQSYWTIQNLEVVNDSPGSNLVSDKPRMGIFVNNDAGGTKRGIIIQNNYVHDVNGCFDCTNSVNGHDNGGIVVGANVNMVVSFNVDSYDGVQILNNTIDQVGRSGIIFDDISSGALLWVDKPALSRNITVAGNTITDSAGDGITVRGAQNVLIEHNIVGGSGQQTSNTQNQPSTVGIFNAKTIDTVIQYNEVYGTKFNVTDGQGYDIDLSASNTIVQYNYSHDNEGGFILLMWGQWSDIGVGATVRYNLSVNDGAVAKGVFAFSYGVKPNTDIYNNTVYVGPGRTTNIMDCISCAVSSAWSFRNNIIENHGSGGYAYPTAAATIDSNIFFGSHPASEPADANKLTSDPQFVNPASFTPAGFQVAATSPAKSSGAVIASNGGRDYFGDPVSSTLPPSRGFDE
jgi:hypothetical protein